MARLGFNTSEYGDFTGDFEPVPKGDYELMAVEAEERDTAAKDGKYISGKFEVLSPKAHAGRLMWNNFNTVNKSSKAEELGRMQLASWARAVGKPNANDTDELLNLPFIASVDIEPGNAGYKDKNKIVGYKSKVGYTPPTAKKEETKPAAAAAEAKPAAAAATETKPAEAKSAPAAGVKKAPWD